MSVLSDLAYRYAPTIVAHHALRRTRAVPLARFPDGRVAKVVGRARPVVAPVRTPLSNRECVYYRIEVQVLDPMSSGWIPVFDQQGGSVFSLVDGDDHAIVEMSRAQISLVTDVDTLSRPRLANRVFVEQMLRWRGYPFHCWLADGPLTYHDGYTTRELRCVESSITLDERVAVCGHGSREINTDPDSAADYRNMATRLVFRAQPRCPLLVSDRPQALR